MEIIWHGLSFIEIKSKEKETKTIIAINPINDSVRPKTLRIKSDIIIFSSPSIPSIVSPQKRPIKDVILDSKNSSSAQLTTPFLIDGPGEYEIKGIKIKGIPIAYDKPEEEKIRENTIFKIEIEKIKMCHLGEISKAPLGTDILENILGVDILFVPIGGNTVLAPEEAMEIVTQVEPKLVIPINYFPSNLTLPKKVKKLGTSLENEKKFLKVLGINQKERIKKLKVKKKDLQGDGMDLILLDLI